MEQNIIKKQLMQNFDENKNSHAFLCTTNNILLTYNDIIDVIKYINCKTKKDNCDCNICRTIENKTNPDLIIIDTENKEIKKEDVCEILNRFSSSPLINKYSVYIIMNAEKMNANAANTILKFLEEPEKNIIGFFITCNQNALIPTIKSRLSMLNFKYKTNNLLDALNISQDDFDKYYEESLKFVNLLNNNKHYILMKESKNYSKKERYEIDNLLKMAKEMYTIKFEYLTTDKYKNANYVNDIIKNIDVNDINIIVKRIKLLDNIISDFGFNVNKDLVFNKLFISWE